MTHSCACRDDVPIRLGKGKGSKTHVMNTWSALAPSTERGIGKKLLKAYHRTRRDFPLVNFMVVYGVKQAGAALFLADIVRFLAFVAIRWLLSEETSAFQCFQPCHTHLSLKCDQHAKQSFPPTLLHSRQ